MVVWLIMARRGGCRADDRSVAGDNLGTGQPMEHGLRTCWLSLAVADALGLDARTTSCVHCMALLRFLECASDASETAVMAGGDDVAFNATMAPALNSGGRGYALLRAPLSRGPSAAPRVGRVVRALSDPGAGESSFKNRYRADGDIGLTDLRSASLNITAAELSSMAIPVLVFAGTTSHLALRSVARRLAVLLPDARLVELADCGHVTYAEQPDQFAHAVSLFAMSALHGCRGGAPDP